MSVEGAGVRPPPALQGEGMPIERAVGVEGLDRHVGAIGRQADTGGGVGGPGTVRIPAGRRERQGDLRRAGGLLREAVRNVGVDGDANGLAEARSGRRAGRSGQAGDIEAPESDPFVRARDHWRGLHQ